jgi:hypothetical protein
MKESIYHKQYENHASALRNWFIIYGIGGIALFIKEFDKLKNISYWMKCVIMISFCCAVFLQIVTTILHKYANWYNYRVEFDPKFNTENARGRCSFAKWWPKKDWIGAIIDMASFFLFLIATIFLVCSFLRKTDTNTNYFQKFMEVIFRLLEAF